MKDILDRLVMLSRQPIRVLTNTAGLRPSDEPFLVGNGSKLRELGWKPQTPIDKTLADILDCWRANPDIAKNK